MTLSRQGVFRPIGQILAHDVLPALQGARRLPLRVSCLGSISPDDAEAPRGHCLVLGEVSCPEAAMRLAARVVSKGDYPEGFSTWTAARRLPPGGGGPR